MASSLRFLMPGEDIEQVEDDQIDQTSQTGPD